MVHIGIDLGGKTSQICIRRSDGKILSEFPASTDRLVPALKECPGSRVILETCSESFAVARDLKAARIGNSNPS